MSSFIKGSMNLCPLKLDINLAVEGMKESILIKKKIHLLMLMHL